MAQIVTMKSLLFFCTCFISAISFSQSTRTLIFKDGVSGEPLHNYSVNCVGSGTTLVTTDENGRAKLADSLMCDTLVLMKWPGPEYSLKIKAPKDNDSVVKVHFPEISLKPAVITESLWKKRENTVTQQVLLLSAADIRYINAQTTADLLQQTGQVSIQKSQQGGGSPVIRGFEANRVLVVIDGVRMNNAIFRSGHLQNILRTDQTTFGGMEVIFGPGVVLYGSDALGGVVYLKTRNLQPYSGKEGLIANIMSRFSSANLERTFHVDFEFSSGKVASYTSFTMTHFGDLRQGSVTNPLYNYRWDKPFAVKHIGGKDTVVGNDPLIQSPSGYLQYDIVQKLAFQTGRWNHTINFQFSNTTDVPRYDRLTETNGTGDPVFAEWYYGPERRIMFAYQAEETSRRSIRFARQPVKTQVNVAYQNFAESRHSRRFGNMNRRIQEEEVHAATLSFYKILYLSRKIYMHYGAEGNFNYVQSKAYSKNILTTTQSPTGTRYPDGGSYYYTAAAYVHFYIPLGEKWLLEAGGRFNYTGLQATFNDTTFFPFPFKDITQNNFAGNGSLGLAFTPRKNIRLGLSGSSGFRAPNVDDVGKVFDSNPGILIVPNLDVRPEYALSGELNFEGTFGRIFTLQANVYGTWVPGLIAVLPSQYNGMDSVLYDGVMSKVFTYSNAADGYIAGGFLGFRLNPVRWMVLSGKVTYTYGRARTVTGEVPLDHIPPLYGRMGVAFKMNRCILELFSIFNGWKRLPDYSPSGEDNLVYATPDGMPAWFTLNAKATVFPTRGLQLQLGVDNMMDMQYRTFSSGISAPGINVYVSVRYNIGEK